MTCEGVADGTRRWTKMAILRHLYGLQDGGEGLGFGCVTMQPEKEEPVAERKGKLDD
jgi:hypothetical protein